MSGERFLANFKLLSQSLKETVSIHYVTDFDNAIGITFLELDLLSDKLSLYFLKIFEENNPYIGVFVKDYIFLPSFILALWKSGKIFSGIGKQYSKTDTLYYLNCLKVKYLITDTNINDYDGKLKSEFYIQDKTFFIWERCNVGELLSNNDLKDICYGIMTSGTTNEPKIINVPWSCILPNAIELSEEFGVETSDCVFQASPCSFDPFFIELFMMLLKGCSLMIVSDTVKLNSNNLLKILFFNSSENFTNTEPKIYNVEKETYFSVDTKQVKRPCVTVLQMTSSVFKMWTDKNIKECILSSSSSLRVLLLGGEPFPKNILNLKSPENKTRIFNIYGITEISCWAFLNEVTNLPFNQEVSLGKPLKDIVYKISQDGELFLGSSTRICFIENELDNDIGGVVFRKTNDVVRLIDGKIYYIGRSNQIVKKYGVKINIVKIEKLFTNEKIKECCCVYNEKCKKLGVFVLPVTETKSEETFKLISFKDFCKNYATPALENLSDIEKPDFLVEIRQMPLNYHGKIDKKKLSENLAYINATPSYKTDLKNVFRNHWLEVLNIKESDLSAKNFMELGGSSLLAMQLVNRLTNRGFKVPQNLISQLLSRESFDSCLKTFEYIQNEDKKIDSIITKKRTINNIVPVGDVKLTVRWKFDLGKCIDATPCVFMYHREERVVVGSHSSKLSCIHTNTGSEIWTVTLGDRIESGFTTNRAKTKGFIGCYDHFVYCIALSDGTFIWKHKTGDMIKSTPCLSSDEKTVFVASYDTKLYCLSTETGKPFKVIKLREGGIFSSGIVSDSLKTFYLGTLNGTCVCISQETNQIIWKVALKSPVFASPCLLESKKEIIFSEVLGIVHCLNAINGTEIWTFKANNNIYSSPVAYEMLIIFGCHDGHLYCLKYEKTSELKWKCQVDSPIFGKPTVLSKSLDVCTASTQGFVYVCDLNSGSVRGHLELHGEIFSSVVQSDHRVFVGCRDDNIYRIDVT